MRAGLVMRQIHHWAALLFLAAIVVPPGPGVLHRRVPPAPRAQLGRRRDAADPGHRQRVRRLLAARRPAVGHRPAHRLLGVLSIPFVGHVAGVAALRRRVPGDRHHPPPVRHPHPASCPSSSHPADRVHLALVVAHKHTHFPGAGRHARTTSSASGCGRPTRSRPAACSSSSPPCVALLGGLAQINPIWLYGPFRPAERQLGVPARLVHGLARGGAAAHARLGDPRLRLRDPQPVLPRRRSSPGITFGLLYAWPLLEARFTKDHAEHHVLDRPRDRPLRTALGVATLAFYTVLGLGGATDALSSSSTSRINRLIWTLRVLLLRRPRRRRLHHPPPLPRAPGPRRRRRSPSASWSTPDSIGPRDRHDAHRGGVSAAEGRRGRVTTHAPWPISAGYGPMTRVNELDARAGGDSAS